MFAKLYNNQYKHILNWFIHQIFLYKLPTFKGSVYYSFSGDTSRFQKKLTATTVTVTQN